MEQLNESLLVLFEECLEFNWVDLYADLMHNFCLKTKVDLDSSFFQNYLVNLLDYLNDPNPILTETIIKFFNALFGKVSKETHFIQVTLLKPSLEQLAFRRLQ